MASWKTIGIAGLAAFMFGVWMGTPADAFAKSVLCKATVIYNGYAATGYASADKLGAARESAFENACLVVCGKDAGACREQCKINGDFNSQCQETEKTYKRPVVPELISRKGASQKSTLLSGYSGKTKNHSKKKGLVTTKRKPKKHGLIK